jgi:hypothetical protein
MLQYLINDHFPGFNLSSLSVIDGDNWVLDVLTSEIRSPAWDRRVLFEDQGMIALKRNRRGCLWILYDDLTHRFIGGGNTWKDSLTCEEAVRTYLRWQ